MSIENPRVGSSSNGEALQSLRQSAPLAAARCLFHRGYENYFHGGGVMQNRQETIRYKAGMAVLVSLLYAATYRLFQGMGIYHELISFNPWLFYPPAFLRLAAFLIIGYWSIPALFIAGFCCIDFGMTLTGIAIVSAFCAVGGPLAVDMTARAISLRASLINLTPLRLLILSLACAVGNAIFMKMGLSIVNYETSKMPDYLSIVIGDTIGTWAMIYLIKTALTVYGRSLKN